MFKELSDLIHDNDSVVIVISKKGDNLSVAVNLTTKASLSPVVMKGSAQEIDENFISALQQPFDAVKSKFYVNTESFDKSIEDAAETKKSTKTSTTKKAEKAKEPEKPKEKDLLIEARSLMAEERYKEARDYLVSIADKLKGADKKEATELIKDARIAIVRKESGFDDDDSDPIIPEEIREIAKESPNIIIGKIDNTEHSDDFDDAEEVSDDEFVPDDDF